MRQRFALSLLYEVPSQHRFGGVLDFLSRGWKLSATTALQSGHPFGVVTLSNPSGTNEFADRPDLVGKPATGSGHADAFLRFAAFSDQFTDRFGTLPRNAMVGPRFTNVDVGLAKDCKTSERVHVQLRADIFNLLNHLNLALPDQLLSDGPNVFGTVTSTTDMGDGNLRLGSGGARQIQLGLKLTF